MKFKLLLLTAFLTLVLTLSTVSASYPTVAEAQDQGVGPGVNPDGSYTFVVEAPPGAFSSVSVVVEGRSHSMSYGTNRWTADVRGVSAGDVYYYRITTAAGVVFESARLKL